MTEDLDKVKQALDRSQDVYVDPAGVVSTAPDLGTKARAHRWFAWMETPTGQRRLAMEAADIRARFPSFQPKRLPDGRFAWHGVLRSNRGYDYEIAVVYPDNFGDAPAKVFPLGLNVKPVRQIHLYKDGSICFAPPDDRLQDQMTAAGLIALTALWIVGYENVTLGGDWCGPATPHEED